MDAHMDNFTYNASFNSYNNRLMCFIDGDVIYQLDNSGQKKIGYVDAYVDEQTQVLQEYYTKLVEVGVIVPEKTPEEILKETQEALLESQKMNREMMQLIKDMKDIKGDAKDVKPSNRKSNIKDVPKQANGNTESIE